MTEFEKFANEIGLNVETDSKGFYTGMTQALYVISVDVVLTDDNYKLDWTEQKELIRNKFFRLFPYLNTLKR